MYKQLGNRRIKKQENGFYDPYAKYQHQCRKKIIGFIPVLYEKGKINTQKKAVKSTYSTKEKQQLMIRVHKDVLNTKVFIVQNQNGFLKAIPPFFYSDL